MTISKVMIVTLIRIVIFSTDVIDTSKVINTAVASKVIIALLFFFDAFQNGDWKCVKFVN